MQLLERILEVHLLRPAFLALFLATVFLIFVIWRFALKIQLRSKIQSEHKDLAKRLSSPRDHK